MSLPEILTLSGGGSKWLQVGDGLSAGRQTRLVGLRVTLEVALLSLSSGTSICRILLSWRTSHYDTLHHFLLEELLQWVIDSVDPLSSGESLVVLKSFGL